MAVEAHRLYTGPQRQLPACYESPPPASALHQPWRRAACYGGRDVEAGRLSHDLQASRAGMGMGLSAAAAAAPSDAATTLFAAGQKVVCAARASESGLTSAAGGGAPHQQEAMAMAMAPRKRKRADLAQGQSPVAGTGAADVAAHLQQQLIDVDRLVLQHTTRMWAELAEQRRRHARQVAAAVEAAAAKRLRAREEEIERVGRLNWALEERVKSLYVEAQVWRDLAQSNEAVANTLRGELQQVLDAQQARRDDAADDAGSCCCGENDGAGAENEVRMVPLGCGRACTVCGESAAEVVLLPCRHLCACAPCAGAATACPACGCAKNGSVCVNIL